MYSVIAASNGFFSESKIVNFLIILLVVRACINWTVSSFRA